MHTTKLIIVEGIPGSGKSTQAAFIKALHDRHQVPNRLYLEGDYSHPADFESVACFTPGGFMDLLERYPTYHSLLEAHASRDGEDIFISYRSLPLRGDDSTAQQLLASLAARDVYEIPRAEIHRRLLRRRWERFAALAAAGDLVYIFECCFLQNPLTVLIGKHNLAAETVRAHLHDLAAIIRPLAPQLIYLQPADIAATLRRAAAERPAAWVTGVTGYFTGQGWGLARGLTGYEGVIAFYQMRAALEQELLPQLDLASRIIPGADLDWEQSQAEIEATLLPALGAWSAAGWVDRAIS